MGRGAAVKGKAPDDTGQGRVEVGEAEGTLRCWGVWEVLEGGGGRRGEYGGKRKDRRSGRVGEGEEAGRFRTEGGGGGREGQAWSDGRDVGLSPLLSPLL